MLCARRVGKSFALMAYALYIALTVPNARVLIVTLTLKNTKKLYWQNLIDKGELFGLGFERPGFSHITDGWLKFDNGSQISMAGAETIGDAEKLRGPPYDLVIVDECSTFNEDVFDYLIEYVLMPATADTNGTVVLGGTPGDIMLGSWFEASYPGYRDPETQEPTTRAFAAPGEFWRQNPDLEPLWSRHHWSQEHNVAKPHLWANSLRRKKAKRWADDNPNWLQEYLGQWTPRSDSLVYSLASVVEKDRDAGQPPRCFFKPGTGEGFDDHGLPLGHDWKFLLGVDYGWHDATAFAVLAYAETFPSMRVVHQYKEPKMTVSRVAEKILALREEYGDFEVEIADTGSAAKQLTESMNLDHGTDLIAAKKTKKPDFIRLLNSDLWDGKLQMEEDSLLAREMLGLHWNLRGEARAELLKRGKLEEDPKADNHLCDAVLYAFKWVQVGEETDEANDSGDELSIDERHELARIEELRRRSSSNSNAPFGENFSDSMEPDPELDQDTLFALGGGIFS